MIQNIISGIISLIIIVGFIYIKNFIKKLAEKHASKEDIKKITEDLEAIKNQQKLNYDKSCYLFKKKIEAYENLNNALHDIKHYCFSNGCQSEHYIKTQELKYTNGFQNQSYLFDELNKNFLFLSNDIRTEIIKITSLLSMLGHQEMYLENNKEDDNNHINEDELMKKNREIANKIADLQIKLTNSLIDDSKND